MGACWVHEAHSPCLILWLAQAISAAAWKWVCGCSKGNPKVSLTGLRELRLRHGGPGWAEPRELERKEGGR